MAIPACRKNIKIKDARSTYNTQVPVRNKCPRGHLNEHERHWFMAGLAIFDQKKSIEETTPINTAFWICFSRRKNELLNRLLSEVRILCF
jgi:hypothetical protein